MPERVVKKRHGVRSLGMWLLSAMIQSKTVGRPVVKAINQPRVGPLISLGPVCGVLCHKKKLFVLIQMKINLRLDVYFRSWSLYRRKNLPIPAE